MWTGECIQLLLDAVLPSYFQPFPSVQGRQAHLGGKDASILTKQLGQCRAGSLCVSPKTQNNSPLYQALHEEETVNAALIKPILNI